MVTVLDEPKADDGGLVFFEGHSDAAVCCCGNDTSSVGFIALEDDLSTSDIRGGSTAKFSRLPCVQCGRVYTWQDEVDRPDDASGRYVRYERVGDFVAQLSREATDAAYALFEQYAGS